MSQYTPPELPSQAGIGGGMMTPPTEPGEIMPPAEPPGWPKVVGIISIVLGSIGTLCGICTTISAISTEAIMQWASQMQPQGAPGVAGFPTGPMPGAFKPNALQLLSSLGWPVATVVLIVAGVMLLRRSAPGRTVHLGYAGLSLLMTVLGMVGGYLYLQSSQKFIAANPDDSWSKFFSIQNGGPNTQFITSVIISLIGMVYPVFCLVWFGIVKKSTRDMTGDYVEEPLV